MKIWKIAVVITLAVSLVLGIVLPGLAAPDEPAEVANVLPDALRGKVLSVDEENQEFFIIQFGEQELTISVNDATRYFKLSVPGRLVALARHRMELRHQNQEELRAIEPAVPMKLKAVDQLPLVTDMDILEHQRPKLKRLRPFGEKATFGDIMVGDRVVVWLAAEENGYLAKAVTIIKPTTYARVVGTITDVSSVNKTITIEPADGSEVVTLDYNERTIFTLRGTIEVESGQSAHAIYDSDNMIAKWVTVYPEMLEPAD